MFNNIFQAKFSLKAILLLSSIILFSCEDKDEDKEAVVPINGTFKLSPESYDCEGLEAVEYLTIDSIFVNIYNDLDDECHESDDTQTDLCYELTTNYVERDGNDLSFTDEGEKISLSLALTGNKLTVTVKDSDGTYDMKYDRKSEQVLDKDDFLPLYDGRICN